MEVEHSNVDSINCLIQERRVLLESLNKQLMSHSIYEKINSLEKLRIFMESHVFAVWDFMSLAKRLQASLTCTDVPWLPPLNQNAARFINEIILHEETDEGADGAPKSHLEMYLDAMHETGASTLQFELFISLIKSSNSIEVAARVARLPEYVSEFVSLSLNVADNREVEEVASYFLHGREDPIPEMFKRLISTLNVSVETVPKLIWYLERHIEVDGNDHGPAAKKILSELIGGNEEKKLFAYNSACAAVQHRINLWDGILNRIENKN